MTDKRYEPITRELKLSCGHTRKIVTELPRALWQQIGDNCYCPVCNSHSPRIIKIKGVKP